MVAPKGSQFWKLRKYNATRPVSFLTPDDLWYEACKYFEWAVDNPLLEDKVFCQAGEIVRTEVGHPRPFTITSMCLFMGVSLRTWYNYKERPEFADVCETIDRIIYEQKFAGTSVGFFNVQIMVRHLGIEETQKVELTGKDGGPLDITDRERAARIAAILDRARNRRAGSTPDE